MISFFFKSQTLFFGYAIACRNSPDQRLNPVTAETTAVTTQILNLLSPQEIPPFFFFFFWPQAFLEAFKCL